MRRALPHLFCYLSSVLAAAGCGGDETASAPKDLLRGPGWALANSPYVLLPGQTITVCDLGVRQGIAAYTVRAVRIWLAAGGRDERLQVRAGCDGDRVVELQPVPNTVPYYGQASPLRGRVHRLKAPPKWAGHWTANHEVGHIFGFAHNVTKISIMNSKDNGRFMNGGHLADYDRREIAALLAHGEFAAANAAWGLPRVPGSSAGTPADPTSGPDRGPNGASRPSRDAGPAAPHEQTSPSPDASTPAAPLAPAGQAAELRRAAGSAGHDLYVKDPIWEMERETLGD